MRSRRVGSSGQADRSFNVNSVAEGSTKTQVAQFTNVGDRPCIGSDTGNNQRQKYSTNGTCSSGSVPFFEVAVDKARQLHLERELNRCLSDSLE